MKNMLKGSISISMPSGHNCDYIEIEIEDKNSSASFVKIHVKYEDFTMALMKMHNTPMEFQVRALDVVGKIREQKDLVFCVEEADYLKDKEYAEAHCQNHADEGWTASTYFRSQNSIRKHDDGKRYAHGMQFRYVEEK